MTTILLTDPHCRFAEAPIDLNVKSARLKSDFADREMAGAEQVAERHPAPVKTPTQCMKLLGTDEPVAFQSDGIVESFRSM
jgi:hypothetical protein